jgi:fructose-1,6-bisphosphatase/inositol monophosphatase family enzyme
MKKLFLLVVFTSLFLFPLLNSLLFITDSLDGYITHGLKQWDIPGLAIVIVKDGKIVFL